MEKAMFTDTKQGLDSGVSKLSGVHSLFSHIKKEYALLLLAAFFSKNIDANTGGSGFSSPDFGIDVNEIVSRGKSVALDSLSVELFSQIERVYGDFREKYYPDNFPRSQKQISKEIKNIYAQIPLHPDVVEKLEKKSSQKRFETMTKEEIFLHLVERKIPKKYMDGYGNTKILFAILYGSSGEKYDFEELILTSTKFFLGFAEKQKEAYLLEKQACLDSLMDVESSLVNKEDQRDLAVHDFADLLGIGEDISQGSEQEVMSLLHQEAADLFSDYQDLLGDTKVHFYDKNMKKQDRKAIDWEQKQEGLKNKVINDLTFEETQELFYLYFGPGLVSQKYIALAKGEPALLQRILLLSSVEKQGQFGTFNAGIKKIWMPDLNKHKRVRGSVITNRGTFQIHAGSYYKMRNKYARYLHKGLQISGITELDTMDVDAYGVKSLTDINLFESDVEKFLGSEGSNQHGRTIAFAQMDLATHLEYLNQRAKMYHRRTGKNLWDDLADPNLSKNYFIKFMSYRVQGGHSSIGRRILQRSNYPVKYFLDPSYLDPYTKSGSSFVDVLSQEEEKLQKFEHMLSQIPQNNLIIASLNDEIVNLKEEKKILNSYIDGLEQDIDVASLYAIDVGIAQDEILFDKQKRDHKLFVKDEEIVYQGNYSDRQKESILKLAYDVESSYGDLTSYISLHYGDDIYHKYPFEIRITQHFDELFPEHCGEKTYYIAPARYRKADSEYYKHEKSNGTFWVNANYLSLERKGEYPYYGLGSLKNVLRSNALFKQWLYTSKKQEAFEAFLTENYGPAQGIEREEIQLTEDEVIEKHRTTFEQTNKTDFVIEKLEEMELLAQEYGDGGAYCMFEIEKTGLDGGPIPTFYNFAVTLVDMGVMKPTNIKPFLNQIKLSCRNTSFAFSDFKFLPVGWNIPISKLDLEMFLLPDWKEVLGIGGNDLAISSTNTISK